MLNGLILVLFLFLVGWSVYQEWISFAVLVNFIFTYKVNSQHTATLWALVTFRVTKSN